MTLLSQAGGHLSGLCPPNTMTLSPMPSCALARSQECWQIEIGSPGQGGYCAPEATPLVCEPTSTHTHLSTCAPCLRHSPHPITSDTPVPWEGGRSADNQPPTTVQGPGHIRSLYCHLPLAVTRTSARAVLLLTDRSLGRKQGPPMLQPQVALGTWLQQLCSLTLGSPLTLSELHSPLPLLLQVGQTG